MRKLWENFDSQLLIFVTEDPRADVYGRSRGSTREIRTADERTSVTCIRTRYRVIEIVTLVFRPRTRHHNLLEPNRHSLKLILTRFNEFLPVPSSLLFFFLRPRISSLFFGSACASRRIVLLWGSVNFRLRALDCIGHGSSIPGSSVIVLRSGTESFRNDRRLNRAQLFPIIEWFMGFCWVFDRKLLSGASRRLLIWKRARATFITS